MVDGEKAELKRRVLLVWTVDVGPCVAGQQSLSPLAVDVGTPEHEVNEVVVDVSGRRRRHIS